MRYVLAILGQDEEMLRVGKYHSGHTFLALFVLAVLGIVAGLGVLIWLWMMIEQWTSEVAIANKRLLYKRGWIARKICEIDIQKVEECNVHQSILGRLFGYGTVSVRGVGIGEVKLPDYLADPIGFRNALDTARERVLETSRSEARAQAGFSSAAA